MDALTQVRQEHRKLEELLERSERLDEDAGAGGAALLGQLQAALRRHVDQEETILYTIFRERARQAEIDLAPLDRAIEQHRLIDRLGRDLAAVGPGDARKAKLTVLAEQVRGHLDEEESAVLSAVEDVVDDDALLELGRRMEQRDRVIEARRELATMIPGGARVRLAGVGAAVLAFLSRRRKPPPPPPTGWRRIRRR